MLIGGPSKGVLRCDHLTRRVDLSATLLLPTDGSEKDGWAFPVGAAFAELAGADIILVRVVNVAAGAHVRRFVERTIAKASKRISAPAGTRVCCEVVDSDDTAAALLRMAEQRDVDLIVMATRAASGIDRAVHGSVADRMVRESRRPIVVAPPGARHVQGKQLRLRRVLVPVDGSRASLSVLPDLQAWPLASEIEVVLLQAAPREPTGGYMMPVPMPPRREPDAPIEWVHVNSERANDELNNLAARLRGRFATIHVRVVERNDAAGAILDTGRSEDVDFIAMTTSGAGGLKRLLLGCVAQAVVRMSQVPVLLVTPGTPHTHP